jgi:hypothetical protein
MKLQANHSTLHGFMVCLQETASSLSQVLADIRNLARSGEHNYDLFQDLTLDKQCQ